MPTIPRLEPGAFDPLSWSAGSIRDLGIPCREEHICAPSNAAKIRSVGVGYCPAEELNFRPKVDEVALMCALDGKTFWFHLWNREFERVFGPIPWQKQKRPMSYWAAPGRR